VTKKEKERKKLTTLILDAMVPLSLAQDERKKKGKKLIKKLADY